ncbi:MAG: ATP phosphoribosyltransferase, partial [Deltaproteobacteria bacterium]
LLERALGADPAAALAKSRKLAWPFEAERLRFLSVRPADLPAYVERGAADLGIVGSDLLREGRHDLYEPIDLGIGRCRLVVAAHRRHAATLEWGDRRPARTAAQLAPLRIATKYPRLATSFFTQRGQPVELTPLHGAVEAAPLLGLCDAIVDITETGETLRQNELVVVAEVMEVSARLVVNRVSLKRNATRMRTLVEAIRMQAGS